MSMKHGVAATLALLLCAAHIEGAHAAPAAADGINYKVKQGDTLYGLANKYLIHLSDYNVLQRDLHLAIAQHLQPATTVVLPRALLKYTPVDAQLVAFRGAVVVNQAAPVIGMAVREGAEISTKTNAFATLTLSNGSKITLPSQTSIKFSRLRMILIDGSLDYEVSLLNGRAETKATHFTDPNSRFQFKTPLATSAVRGTEFRIAYAKSGESDSLTEVLGGAVAVGAPSATAPQLIPSGTGAGISKTGATHTEQLLPAPEVRNAADIQKDDAVHFTFSPIAGAASYHVQLSHDAGFVDVFDEARSSSPEASFAHVPNGKQFVRVTALSATGFEGLPSSSVFVRKLNSIKAIVEQGGHGGFHFKWFGSGSGTTQYRFQLTSERGATPLIDEPGLHVQGLELTNLVPGSYYWRVAATQYEKGEASVSWTDFEKLTIPGAKKGQ
jgi:hypothetical protein